MAQRDERERRGAGEAERAAVRIGDDGEVLDGEETQTEGVHSTFRHSVAEGVARLGRSWPSLLSTGFMGGLDVSLGVLAMLVVIEATGSVMAGSIAFSIGFLALALGRSELFTENFLVPVAAVAAKKARLPLLLRLWAGTLVMNLLGGWIFAWLIVKGLPQLAPDAIRLATHFAELPFLEATALGLMGGTSITLMTWMEHGAEAAIGRLAAVVAVAFLLAAAHLNHVIVVSIEMFVALHSGEAPFGYLDWLRVAGWATVMNMVGGLLLVTLLRLVQVGRRKIEEASRSALPTAEERKQNGEV